MDEAGLSITGDTPEVRAVMDSPVNAQDWPSPILAPFLAFAQHYGMPTRLLDWSTSDRVAAYFAASGAYAEESIEAPLAIIALDSVYAKECCTRIGRGVQLTIISVPRASNQNLHAQSGLFTLIRHSNLYGRELPLEHVVWKIQTGHWTTTASDGAQPAERRAPTAKLIRVLTLPRSEAGNLLQLLAHDGITATKLFPNPDGVLRGIAESALGRWHSI